MRLTLLHKLIFFLVSALLGLSSCSPLEPRRPLNEKKAGFLEASIVRNKRQYGLEQELFKQIIAQEKNLAFQSSQYGFWYAYKTKSSKNTSLPQKGDKVIFTFEIADLNNTVLYTKTELGQPTYYVDEEDILPALRKGIRIMRPGDEIIFLFPSYLCYSYLGDGEKITVNQPLRFTINMLSLESKPIN